jgi:membrane fusion protein, type I secretion system
MKAPLGMQAQGARRSIRRNMLVGVSLVTFLGAALGGWASTTDLAGAVVAGGSVVVDSHIKKVQHQKGGTVRDLLVREGAQVTADDVLIRLDDTQARASLVIVNTNLAELYARQARLEAERDDAETIDFGPLSAVALPGGTEKIIQAEHKLFELRRTARAGQKSQLSERVGQLQEEIEGLKGQHDARAKEIGFIQTELTGVRELWSKNLIPIQRVTALERDAVRIAGEHSSLISTIAQTKGKITETTLKIIQIDQDLRSEVAKELREIQAKIGEFQERKVSAEDILGKIEIRAPQSGRVHQLAVHTVRGVIAPGEPIMYIVPAGDMLIVEVRIAPHEIDRVHHGQMAMLRFTAFDQRTTPELMGEVVLVSADVTQDAKTGVSYFAVRVAVPDEEVARLKGTTLVPGMPVESFIQTGERTVISYLVKPIRDQVMRAFRER